MLPPALKVKSARYDEKRRMVQGQHRSLYLRLASPDSATEWADAIHDSAINSAR